MAEDYDTLVNIISQVRHLRVTPNTLTKASNLLGQHREPERSRLLGRLREFIELQDETVVASRNAASDPAFPRLGLTDTVLLNVVSGESPLLSVDASLCVSAQRAQCIVIHEVLSDTYRYCLMPGLWKILQSSGASVHDFARRMTEAGTRSWYPVLWINQYAWEANPTCDWPDEDYGDV